MSDTDATPPARESDTPAGERPEPARSQRQIIEYAYAGITTLSDVDPDASRIVRGSNRDFAHVLKLVFADGETWWLSAVRGDDR